MFRLSELRGAIDSCAMEKLSDYIAEDVASQMAGFGCFIGEFKAVVLYKNQYRSV